MKARIFRRIFLIYAAVLLAAGIFTELYITSAVRENYVANLESHLLDTVSLASKMISFDKPDLDVVCRDLKSEIHARVTVILPDGRVIGDSDHDSGSMENHENRTEVQQAALLGSGSAVRRSHTLGYDFLYVAKQVAAGGKEEGFIRLAVPLSEIDSAVNALRGKIILVMLAVLFATLAVSTWQTDHLRRLLHQITEFSRSLSKGEIDKRLFLKNAGEFTEIADNLTAMSVTLQEMMTRCAEERNRLSVILRSVPDALLIIDAKGMVILSSESVKDFFGDIPAAAPRFAEIVRNHEFTELIGQVRESRIPGMSQFMIESPSEKYLAVRVSPLFYREGELSGFVAVFHDITEIKKLEQVRKDFVANVSHELKTPITAIRGFADTLLDGALADRENAARFIETIRSNSERINALVDDLMTISKIELGVIKVEKARTDIRGVFENIVELFGAKSAAKGLFLEVETDPALAEIEADRNRLLQILTNLVDNAIKFTEAGGVTFGIEGGGEGGRPFLFVQDTGTGVPAKFLPRLGERFFRVDPARSRKMGGTGLGLAIVKHLVKAHGWSMKVESVHGKGTKVLIVL
ncbi:MAG: ATP-binding protein [Nitrospiraceae bacterium]|nr:ATP-binding protein [Nitrospiraceae bacterium]